MSGPRETIKDCNSGAWSPRTKFLAHSQTAAVQPAAAIHAANEKHLWVDGVGARRVNAPESQRKFLAFSPTAVIPAVSIWEAHEGNTHGVWPKCFNRGARLSAR